MTTSTLAWEKIDETNKHYGIYAAKYAPNTLGKKEIMMKQIVYDTRTGRPQVNASVALDDAIKGVRMHTINKLLPDGTKEQTVTRIACLWYCIQKTHRKSTARTSKRKFSSVEDCEFEAERLKDFYEKHKTAFKCIEDTRREEAALKKRKLTEVYKESLKLYTKYDKETKHIELCFMRANEAASAADTDAPSVTMPPPPSVTMPPPLSVTMPPPPSVTMPPPPSVTMPPPPSVTMPPPPSVTNPSPAPRSPAIVSPIAELHADQQDSGSSSESDTSSDSD
jgi:hypothetical protein